jgi:hypothetical protein
MATDTNFPHPFQHEEGSPTRSITIDVPEFALWSALTSAFEGGSNYWTRHVINVNPRPAGSRYRADVIFLGGALFIDPSDPATFRSPERFSSARMELARSGVLTWRSSSSARSSSSRSGRTTS